MREDILLYSIYSMVAALFALYTPYINLDKTLLRKFSH